MNLLFYLYLKGCTYFPSIYKLTVGFLNNASYPNNPKMCKYVIAFFVTIFLLLHEIIFDLTDFNF